MSLATLLSTETFPFDSTALSWENSIFVSENIQHYLQCILSVEAPIILTCRSLFSRLLPAPAPAPTNSILMFLNCGPKDDLCLGALHADYLERVLEPFSYTNYRHNKYHL